MWAGHLAVLTGAPLLRDALDGDAIRHDPGLYEIQEALRGWRRWAAESDTVEDGAAVLFDGMYALRLRPDDVHAIINTSVVAEVGELLRGVASLGKNGLRDQKRALARDDRAISEQWREIRTVLTEWRAGAGSNDD